jgi:hypothetical protein
LAVSEVKIQNLGGLIRQLGMVSLNVLEVLIADLQSSSEGADFSIFDVSF